MSFNTITITISGNLTKDAELKEVNGAKVANFGLFCNRGEKEAIYCRVSAWGNQAEPVGTYAKKGMKVLVTGSCKPAMMLTKDGEPLAYLDIRATNVEFCSGGSGEGSKTGSDDKAKLAAALRAKAAKAAKAPAATTEPQQVEVSSDELPFD